MNEKSQNPLISATRSNWIRLRTFVTLRWFAIFGQTSAILFASYYLELRIPLDLCFIAIGASVIFNLVATVTKPSRYRLTERGALLTLMFDLGQLAVLLYLTGGLSNPFSILLLAPVIISATALSLRAMSLLGVIFVMIISFLIWNFVPLQTQAGTIIQQSSLLLFGNWTALIIGLAFFALYARRVTVENFTMSEALSAAQLALGREHRLTSLGGVVAAAAHELGSPLATIKLVATEMSDDLPADSDLAKDAALIRSQADRCRDILRDMGQSGKEDLHLQSAPITAIIEEAAAPHIERGKTVLISVNGNPHPASFTDQPDISRRPEIIHGLRNFIQNAVDFAIETVWVEIEWDDKTLSVIVSDDGKGYPTDLLGQLGDPFVTRRSKYRHPEYEGMGLGLFIAKTLLEGSGATVTFANGSMLGIMRDSHLTDGKIPRGAIVTAEWDIDANIFAQLNSRDALGANKPITN